MRRTIKVFVERGSAAEFIARLREQRGWGTSDVQDFGDQVIFRVDVPSEERYADVICWACDHADDVNWTAASASLKGILELRGSRLFR